MKKIICQQCGKKMSRHPSARFCFECVEKRRIESEERRLVRKKEGFTKECIFCGLKTEEIHHADMDKENDNKFNLIPLCRKCHRKIHALIIKPILKRYGKRNKSKRK